VDRTLHEGRGEQAIFEPWLKKNAEAAIDGLPPSDAAKGS
jgi:hypothetical protein